VATSSSGDEPARAIPGFAVVEITAEPLSIEPTGAWCTRCLVSSGVHVTYAVGPVGCHWPMGLSTVHCCPDCGLVLPTP
jgi:hypothetical protein